MFARLFRAGRESRCETAMPYTTVDGDVSNFLDSMLDLTDEFRTDELRTYLHNEGHSEPDVASVIRDWQRFRFERVDPQWETFKLTSAGMSAVAELRGRID